MKQGPIFLGFGLLVGLVAGYSLGHGVDAPVPVAPPPRVGVAAPAPVTDVPPVPVPEAVRGPGVLGSPAPVKATSPPPLGAPAAAPVPVHSESDLEAVLAKKDRLGALRLVADLSRAGRESWPLAAKTLLELQRSIEDEDNPLGINVTRFYKAVRRDAFAPLYADAIQNPAAYDAAFRRFAVREVVWTDQDDVGALLANQLVLEKDARVAGSLAGALVERADPSLVDPLVAAAKAHPQDARVRSWIADAIASIPGDAALQALNDLASVETDPSVRQDLTVAALARTVPVPGYLITDVGRDSQAAQAGLHAGDLLATYGGTPINSMADLEKAKSAVPEGQSVVLGIVRDGQTITVTLKGGRIGIDGKVVKPRS